MITEDFCSVEVIKLFKEKGFPFKEYKGRGVYIPSVTHSLAMKWLRTKGIYIVINPLLETKPVSYWYFITSKESYTEREGFSTYIECVDAALKYSLEKFNL